MQRIVRLTGAWRPRILVLRHATHQRNFFAHVLGWMEHYAPDVLAMFLFEDLPCRRESWGEVVAHHAWLQDPVREWSPEANEQALWVCSVCDRLGIPVINRVERLDNAGKVAAARTLAALGVRTPRMHHINDPEEFRETFMGLEPPLFVREDLGHQGAMHRADTPAAVRAIDLSRFKRPVVSEFIDVSAASDGLYRKYRCFIAGDHAVSQHLQVSATWITRGTARIQVEKTKQEELAYIGAPDPNEALFQRARRALGLDLVGFDYGYDLEGRMVVWEANPYPYVAFARDDTKYRNGALHRSVLAMVRMYLDVGAVPYPASVRRLIEKEPWS